jgi:hypothetical protein
MRKLFAQITGYVAERSGLMLRTLPGAAGALLVSYGLYRAWLPLGFIAAGGFLLLIDRRVP